MQSLQAVPCTAPAAAQFYKFCGRLLVPAQRRHESSYRRSRSKLNIKPDASFLPSTTETYDHIVYNPPPSMPNVYHTPSLFLPKSETRRQLQPNLISGGLNSQSTSQTPASPSIPPRVSPEKPWQRYHVTREQAQEMRTLRKEDPNKWSQQQLAKKYNCSPFFVSLVCKGLAEDKKQLQQQVTDYVKSRWGVKRRIAREDRVLRQEKWFRDE